MPSGRLLTGRLPSGGGRWGCRKGAGEHDGQVIAVALACCWARTVRCNKTRVCGEHRGAFQRSNATHRAAHWAEGIQKRQNSAIYPPKPTVEDSVSACVAVRQIGAGEHPTRTSRRSNGRLRQRPRVWSCPWMPIPGGHLRQDAQPPPQTAPRVPPEGRWALYARLHRPNPRGGVNRITARSPAYRPPLCPQQATFRGRDPEPTFGR